jgi:hypothetical protein
MMGSEEHYSIRGVPKASSIAAMVEVDCTALQAEELLPRNFAKLDVQIAI